MAAYAGRKGTEKIIAVGASTGGTEAIRTVLCGLPGDGPAVVITQHMPPGFTKSFSQRLDSLARMAVKEAEEGERILPGHAYVAPGGMQFAIEKSGANYVARVWEGEPVNRHRPSVDVLFRSVARVAGANALAQRFGLLMAEYNQAIGDGKISVNEFSTYVAVDRQVAAQVLRKLSAGKVKGRSVKVRLLEG